MLSEEIAQFEQQGLVATLGIRITQALPDYVEGYMPITPAIQQPFGYVHGGATLSLLETVASLGGIIRADLSNERPFGTVVNVRHRKSGKAGEVRGVAKLERIEGAKQFWHVCAFDDAGDVMSEGTVEVKTVSLERLAQKQEEERARATEKRTR